MKTILVSTDFSRNAFNAVKYAFAYSKKIKAKVILFHSYDNLTNEVNIPFADIRYREKELKQAAEAEMNKLTAALIKMFPSVKPKCVIKSGIASNSIVDYVKQNKIDLVIIGTTGEGKITRAFMGSTTSNVIENVSCPCLVVPSKAKFKSIRKVAIATDLDNDNLLAVDKVIPFAKQFQAEVSFIHVHDIELLDEEDTLEKMTYKIRKRVNYKKLSLFLCMNHDVINGLEFFIKKQKPDILSMVVHNRKFPETIWKKNRVNKMSNHTSIPILVLHVNEPEFSTKKDNLKQLAY